MNTLRIAGNYGSPIPFIKKSQERITHLQIKDRKANARVNVPFGEGDTPVREVLQAIRDHRFTAGPSRPSSNTKSPAIPASIADL